MRARTRFAHGTQRVSGRPSGFLFARNRTNVLVSTSRACLYARAAPSITNVATSWGPETGHDVEFMGQDDNGRCAPPTSHMSYASYELYDYGCLKCTDMSADWYRLTVRGRMQLLSCSPEEVYDAVTDYPRAPEIFGNIAESTVTRDVRPYGVCLSPHTCAQPPSAQSPPCCRMDSSR
jgi:hypothetical protein